MFTFVLFYYLWRKKDALGRDEKGIVFLMLQRWVVGGGKARYLVPLGGMT